MGLGNKLGGKGRTLDIWSEEANGKVPGGRGERGKWRRGRAPAPRRESAQRLVMCGTRV